MCSENKFKEFITSNNKDLTKKKEATMLFFSFDLVNSSKYKMYSCNWLYCIKKILYGIENIVLKKIHNSQLWRCIGDELVFTVNITEKKELYSIVQNIYEILYDLNETIKNGKIFDISSKQSNSSSEEKCYENNNEFSLEKLILGVKSTAWIAIVKQYNEKSASSSHFNDLDDNIEYTFSTGQDNNPMLQEFQGKDIDTGFRIAKYNSCERRLTLSLELAYILCTDSRYVRRLHIISYQRLKGVFNSRLYPVIWYHDEYVSGCSLKESFYYDEDEDNEIIQNYFNKEKTKKIRFKDNKSTKEQLEKIVKDINLHNKINKIVSTMEITTKTKDYGPNSLLQIHCVAVCYCKDTNSVLIFKRHNNDKKYPQKWDFGCCKMVFGKTFAEQLQQNYRKLINVDIEVLEPFKEFKINRNGITIPGIRFYAVVEDYENIKLNDTSKYEECKLVTLDDFNKTYADNVIDKDEFNECINSINNRFKGEF